MYENFYKEILILSHGLAFFANCTGNFNVKIVHYDGHNKWNVGLSEEC